MYMDIYIIYIYIYIYIYRKNNAAPAELPFQAIYGCIYLTTKPR